MAVSGHGKTCRECRLEPTAPDKAKLDAMHHEAHEACYIANSVRTEVSVV